MFICVEVDENIVGWVSNGTYYTEVTRQVQQCEYVILCLRFWSDCCISGEIRMWLTV